MLNPIVGDEEAAAVDIFSSNFVPRVFRPSSSKFRRVTQEQPKWMRFRETQNTRFGKRAAASPFGYFARSLRSLVTSLAFFWTCFREEQFRDIDFMTLSLWPWFCDIDRVRDNVFVTLVLFNITRKFIESLIDWHYEVCNLRNLMPALGVTRLYVSCKSW